MSVQTDVASREIEALRDTRSVAAARSKFYFGMAVAMAVVVLMGFGPSFYLNAYLAQSLGLPPLEALSPIIVVHGIAFTIWMIVLMVQTGLVARSQVRWHRRLGVAGAVLAASIVVLGIAVQVASVRRDLSAAAIQNLPPFLFSVFFGGFVIMTAFAGLASAAIYWRRRPDIHKRLILIATIALISAATARIARILGMAIPPLGAFSFLGLVLMDLFLVALLVHDWRTTKRVHPATLYGALTILAMQVLSNSPLNSSPPAQLLLRWIAA
jgi:hypothetical protein